MSCTSTSPHRSLSCSRRLWPILGESGGRREALSALHLHFTTQIPVPLKAPVADFGGKGREERGLVGSCPPLHHKDPQTVYGVCGPRREKGREEGGPVGAVPPLHRDALPEVGAPSQHHDEGAHVAVVAATTGCLALDGQMPPLPIVPTSCR